MPPTTNIEASIGRANSRLMVMAQSNTSTGPRREGAVRRRPRVRPDGTHQKVTDHRGRWPL